jgi:hypothetical protein
MSAVAFERLGELFAPLTHLLARGGDTRLALDPATRLNGYGCRPYPRPEAITFASSTATSISERAYRASEAAQASLIRAALHDGLELAFDARVEALRGELCDVLGLAGMGAEIVFSPSGTDSELHAVFLARTMLGTPVASIIVASDETGSGVPDASCGKHFNSLTAQGAAVEKGNPIAGLAEDMTTLSLPLRQDGGTVQALHDMDAAVLDAVARTHVQGRRVLLHVMDHSKLGARCPSRRCLSQIRTRWGEDVQIVVDACQMRLGRARLRWHLEQGHMVLITGSKFFTGPPFSGALIVPRGVAAVMVRARGIPVGLADYTSRSDWPRAWAGVRDALSERANFGQLLRWIAAAQEMRDYFAVPASYRRQALARFAAVVPALIAGTGFLDSLPDHDRYDGGDDEEMATRTIFPFRVRRGGRPMSFTQCATLYRALNGDVSAQLPDATAEERTLAARLCHIGQPVMLGQSANDPAALRISAGARVVSETWAAIGDDASLANLEREFAEVRVVLDKLALLLRHFEAIERAARERAPLSRRAPELTAERKWG